jgi:formate dehydrogenase major subunit
MTKMFKITIDNKSYEAQSGETILQVAERNGIKIPTLCHDKRLAPYSSCFVCVVEIEGVRNMQPSCSTRVYDGMVVHSNNEKVHKARKTALDLIMSNHYADCVGPCKLTCPAHVDVQGYISLIEKGQYSEAIGLIKQKNPLPAICGRVCVRPCEIQCRRNLLEEETGVGVDYLKRFAADKDLESGTHYKPEVAESTNKKIAIIGAGPGGLSAAYWLQIKGHQCDIYEAMAAPGGWLRYGIPEYRLPNDILDKEIETITELGVNIFCNQKLGDNLDFADIHKRYDSVILTIGSQKGTLLGAEGEETGNVYSGIDFLRNMQVTGKQADFRGKTVAVVGGGNTAMDCCRTSIRCNAEKVYVIYRRTEKEMPANPIEIHESKIEGVEYLFLTNPVKVNSENDQVKSVTVTKMELGEPDASGRRRPMAVKGSEFDIPVDYILAAIGQKTDVNFLDNINKHASEGELKINKWGDLDADPITLQTGIPGIFAAGDGVSGPATIIEAIAQAQIASRSAHQFLMGETLHSEKEEFVSRKDNFQKQDESDYKGHFEVQYRQEMPVLSEEARNNFNEVELGYTDEQVAIAETQRCLECGCTEFFNCDLQKYASEYGADQEKYKGAYNNIPVDFRHPFIEIDNNKCIWLS